jgi:glycosyltransferase involved in cell wall biosynthesis
MGAIKNIYEVYPRYDFFIMSSYFEGCPNALFEALLSKRFCIISIQSNTDDFIKSNVNGLVYDGTDEGLTKVILYALSIVNSELYFKIIESGYEYAFENFSINKMVSEHECFYEKLVELNKN